LNKINSDFLGYLDNGKEYSGEFFSLILLNPGQGKGKKSCQGENASLAARTI